MSRTGFQVLVPGSSDKKLDPVGTLKVYIERTESVRPKSTVPVFIALLPPYGVLSSATIGNILAEAIELAGLKDRGFSAKSFRPTGATLAVDNLCSPDVAMQIGRWKSQTVFMNHYVHSKVPEDYTQNLLNCD